MPVGSVTFPVTLPFFTFGVRVTDTGASWPAAIDVRTDAGTNPGALISRSTRPTGSAAVLKLPSGSVATRDLGRPVIDTIETSLMALLNRQAGTTFVMVTHDPRAAAKARRLVHLEKGQLADTP